MKSKTSVKVCNEGKNFLDRLKINRIKADIDKSASSYSDLIELIGKYFKLNNNSYLELVALEKS